MRSILLLSAICSLPIAYFPFAHCPIAHCLLHICIPSSARVDMQSRVRRQGYLCGVSVYLATGMGSFLLLSVICSLPIAYFPFAHCPFAHCPFAYCTFAHFPPLAQICSIGSRAGYLCVVSVYLPTGMGSVLLLSTICIFAYCNLHICSLPICPFTFHSFAQLSHLCISLVK